VRRAERQAARADLAGETVGIADLQIEHPMFN
jgi:hypothetical protein